MKTEVAGGGAVRLPDLPGNPYDGLIMDNGTNGRLPKSELPVAVSLAQIDIRLRGFLEQIEQADASLLEAEEKVRESAKAASRAEARATESARLAKRAERLAESALRRQAELEDELAGRSGEKVKFPRMRQMVEAADGQLDASGGLDLNSVEVDDLRAIGLSLNQAVRVVVQRDRRGGFASVDEVDRLQGLPREIKEQLKLFTGV